MTAADGPLRFASAEALGRDAMAGAPVRSSPRPSLLAEPLDVTNRRTAAALETLGIETPGDLLEHLPFPHEDRREARPIVALVPGESATVIADVRRISTRRARRGRPMVEATVADESGVVKAVWFNQPWLADRLSPGSRLVLHGKRTDRNRFWVTSHEVAEGVTPDDVRAEGMTPVYPATEGITSDRLRELAKRLRGLEVQTVDFLPGRMRAREGLPERPAALAAVHFPEDEAETELARRRLAFEELLLLKLALLARKRARREAQAAVVLEPLGELVGPWLASLPFTLTRDQRAALEALDRDLASGRPMQRLLMGEVGSGKTVVALHAMLRAAENGRQAALMAPTETLAEQHLATLDRLLGGHLPIALLTSSTPPARRRDVLARLDSGELGMVVGTHALIEESVEFRDLALVVVDEQHRFGVRQRSALEDKAPPGLSPHVLHLTATPIPRTFRLMRYGDLDCTVLRGLPAGRRPVDTHVVDGARGRERAYERAREEIAAGRQGFVVCPLVEGSGTLPARAATAKAQRPAPTGFRQQRVERIHGP